MITVKNDLKKMSPDTGVSGMIDINQEVMLAVNTLFPILEENLSVISHKYDATVLVVGDYHNFDFKIETDNEEAKAEIEKIITESL